MATFQHQVIFDVLIRETRHLTSISLLELPPYLNVVSNDETVKFASFPLVNDMIYNQNNEHCGYNGSQSCSNSNLDLDFLGSLLEPLVACGIADGLVDPNTQVIS
jgi:hypothetical protein